MKNLLILIVLGGVITYFVTSSEGSFSLDINKVLDQFYVSKSRMLGMVAGFQDSQGEVEKAIEYFDSSQEVVDNIKNATKRIKESLNIVEKKSGSSEIVKETAEQDIDKIIKEITNIPEEEKQSKEEIFENIVNILPKIDIQPEDVYSGIENTKDQSMFLFNIALLYLKEEKQDLAINTIKKITDEYYRKIAIMILLDKTSDIRDKKDLTKEFDGSVVGNFIYLNNLRNILSSGNIDNAKQFVMSFEDVSLQKMGWMEIFNFEIKKGNIDSALEILKTQIY